MVRTTYQEPSFSRWPYLAAAVILVLAFFALGARLAYLQLTQGAHFAEISEHNRIRLQDIPPTRGMIFDRNGVLLVDNQPSFDLCLIREDVDDMPQLLTNLENLLELDQDLVKERIEKFRASPPFDPITIKPDLTRDELARVETYKYENPGLYISTEPRRYYLFPELAAHLIGYTGQVTERQLATGKLKGVKLGDRVGQYGVEQSWQSALAGRRGGRQVEVDATGRRLDVLQEIPAQPGYNLVLTIDARLQRAAEEALGDKAGAVVALDPETGQVLAMVSRPTFDQTKFIRGISATEWKTLASDPLHPLENRSLNGQYPPGSTYKIVTALAGLMEGVITPDTTFYCPGSLLTSAAADYGCWKKGGHGNISLHRALVESCDVYFYRVGQKAGRGPVGQVRPGPGVGPAHRGGPPSGAAGFGAHLPVEEETVRDSLAGRRDPVRVHRPGVQPGHPPSRWPSWHLHRGQRRDPSDPPGGVGGGEGRRNHCFRLPGPGSAPTSSCDKRTSWIPDQAKALWPGWSTSLMEPEAEAPGSKDIDVGGKTGTAQVITLEKYKGVKDIRGHSLQVPRPRLVRGLCSGGRAPRSPWPWWPSIPATAAPRPRPVAKEVHPGLLRTGQASTLQRARSRLFQRTKRKNDPCSIPERRFISRFDWVLLFLTLLLAGVGLVNLYSASLGVRASTSAPALTNLGVGLAALVIVVAIPYQKIYSAAYFHLCL